MALVTTILCDFFGWCVCRYGIHLHRFCRFCRFCRSCRSCRRFRRFRRFRFGIHCVSTGDQDLGLDLFGQFRILNQVLSSFFLPLANVSIIVLEQDPLRETTL